MQWALASHCAFLATLDFFHRDLGYKQLEVDHLRAALSHTSTVLILYFPGVVNSVLDSHVWQHG